MQWLFSLPPTKAIPSPDKPACQNTGSWTAAVLANWMYMQCNGGGFRGVSRFPRKPPFEIASNPSSFEYSNTAVDWDSLIEQSDWRLRCSNHSSFTLNIVICELERKLKTFFFVLKLLAGLKIQPLSRMETPFKISGSPTDACTTYNSNTWPQYVVMYLMCNVDNNLEYTMSGQHVLL